MKWVALIFASLVVLALGMTAIDKYDERTCVQAQSESVRSRYAKTCDGFLPW